MKPDLGRLLTALLLVSAGVGIMRAIGPPWPLWQVVLLGVVLGLVLDAGLQRLRSVL